MGEDKEMTQTTIKTDDFVTKELGHIAVLCILIIGLYLLTKAVLS